MKQHDDIRGEAMGIDHDPPQPDEPCPGCNRPLQNLATYDGGDTEWVCTNPGCSDSVTYEAQEWRTEA